VGGIPLPPFDVGLHFARCVCPSCVREERREVRDLPNLSKSIRMLGGFHTL
jgi:hypothetical protein